MAESDYEKLEKFLTAEAESSNADNELPRKSAALLAELLSSGHDVNRKDRRRNTLLHNTAKTGQLNLTKLMLAHGARVNVANNFQYTPLHFAVMNKHVEVVKLLLANKANVNVFSIHGETALHLAVDGGSRELMALLLNNGADPNKHNEKVAFEPYLYKLDYIDKSGVVPYHLVVEGNEAPLFAAIKLHCLDSIRLLLAYGARLDVRTYDGHRGTMGVIHAAVRWIQHEDLCRDVVKLFVQRGASLEDVDSNDLTAVQVAAGKHFSKVCDLLAESGATPKLANYSSEELLFTAINKGMHEVVKSLIVEGLDLNTAGIDHESMLTCAIENNDPEMLTLLLENGLSMSNNEVLRMSVDRARCDFFKVLFMDIFEVRPNSDAGLRTFIYAICRNRLEIVQFYLEIGVTLNVEVKDRLPLDYALDVCSLNHTLPDIQQVSKALIRHIALRFALNLHVRDENILLIESELWAAEFFETNVKEVGLMRGSVIDDNYQVTYLDLLIRDCTLLAKFFRNPLPTSIMDCGLYKKKFTNYSGMLEKSYTQIRMLSERINKFEDVLLSIFGRAFPRNVVCKIAEYYNDEDFAACIE